MRALGRSLPGARPANSVRRPHPMRVLWLSCLVIGVFLIGSFAYGMLGGVREQQHLNQVWQGQVGERPPVPAGVDPALKPPVHRVDFPIRIPKLEYYAAVNASIDAGVLYSRARHHPTTKLPYDTR